LWSEVLADAYQEMEELIWEGKFDGRQIFGLMVFLESISLVIPF
jgi:hypothetical protein